MLRFHNLKKKSLNQPHFSHVIKWPKKKIRPSFYMSALIGLLHVHLNFLVTEDCLK